MNQKKIVLLKVTRNKRLLRKGQKAWLLCGSGAQAGLALTRFKGYGRWINCWLHWDDEDWPGKAFPGHGKADCKWIGKVEVSDDFYRQLQRTPQGRHWLD